MANTNKLTSEGKVQHWVSVKGREPKADELNATGANCDFMLDLVGDVHYKHHREVLVTILEIREGAALVEVEILKEISVKRNNPVTTEDV